MTTPKYEIKDGRVVALRDFGDVKTGDVGGFVDGEHNLSHDGLCWIFGDARVSGRTWVSGDARVAGRAQVSGDALVFGRAQVFGDARVSGNVCISGDTILD